MARSIADRPSDAGRLHHEAAMRVGHNPAKFVEGVARPERITVVMISYIPFLSGYFAGALDVLKASLRSLRENTAPPFDLLVFDNGSGEETVTFLQDLRRQGGIQYLMLSDRNVGKAGAWDIVIPAAPGEILAYADSDVYFYPGWLPAGMAILETFPRVGMVTCRPMRTSPDLTSATLAWAERDPEARLQPGRWISWETFREHDLGLGQEEDEIRKRYEATQDLRLEYRGQVALVGAVHWQFVAHKRVLQQFVPLAIDQPLSGDRKLDELLDRAGYLRLMTAPPLVRHLGNTLPADLANELAASTRPPAPRRRARWLDWKPLRSLLLRLHNAIFRWYSGA